MTRSLRKYLLSLTYRDGIGRTHAGAVDLYANCLLLDCGVRPSFLVHFVDYEGRGRVGLDVATKIVRKMADAGYHVTQCNQGFVVFTDRMSSTIEPMVSRYNRSGRRSDKLMGQILGYPAWNDFPGSRRLRRRLTFDWTVKLKGYGGEHQVMANVFQDRSLVPDMEALALEMAECLEPKGFRVYTTLFEKRR